MNDQSQREELFEDLHDIMSREVSVLREVLANMHAEQHAILNKDRVSQLILNENRVVLVNDMRKLRELMITKMEVVEESAIEAIPKAVDGDSQFLTLKDQILTLGQKIHDQKKYNHSLQSCQCYCPQPDVKKNSIKIGLITLERRTGKPVF